jgi:TonB dependent receptor
MNYLASFLQDSWTIGKRVTLNLGIRYAHDNGFLPAQCRVAASAPFQDLYPAQCWDQFQSKIWNPVTPRIHVAYDLSGDGKTLIKGGWGRFATMRTQDELNIANDNADLNTVFRWNDLNRDNRFQAGESNLDPHGPDFVSRSVAVVGSLAGMVQNPDQKEPGSNEYSVSFERELLPNFGVRVTGLYFKNFNTLRLLNTLRPYDSYNIPITNPDPGPDGRLGTADDPGTSVTYFDYPASLAGAVFQRLTLINDPNSDASYRSLEIAASKRLSQRWQFMGSYTATKRNEPFRPDVAGQGRGMSLTSYNPNVEIFGADTTWEWSARFAGSYLLPADVQLSANLESRSGEPWARTVSFAGGRQIPSITLRVEPIGTHRSDTMNILTLGVQKSVQLFPGNRVSIRAQIFNALNQNFTAVSGNPQMARVSTLSGPSFGRVTGIANPRVGEIVISYAF